MVQIKKSTTLKGTFKNITINADGVFVDFETGEMLDVAGILFETYGDEPFTMQTASKIDEDIDVTTPDEE